MRFGILSDAHGNIEAFELALTILADAKADVIYFLGDAVGYIPEKAVVGALQAAGIPVVRGNHDDMLVRQTTAADREAIYRHRETYALLSNDERDFVGSWPSKLTVRDERGTILFVHGSPKNPLEGYVYPDSSLSDFAEVDADVVFMGHTHHPFVRRHADKLFVNVGSCGLPRGSDLRGSVCIFDPLERAAEIIRFDISGPCRRALSRYPLAPPVASLLERCAAFNANEVQS
ncbi:metallophosphoesterase [Bradyrhizobium sp. CCBAU 53421]|uniref:metallophosphoesterase family protein n=1 Tax=Bradyrhizobium sp. CCBAU 53421 TaxID=1325120 RepID=UPI00188B5827|nr:metallophosphoesterase family protein [Bradyrhizobium sp. CCBAU 53421]QOZ33059.1 metallophosphoesterase [Bradyrhizobium sp. CCBAU 53421]